MIRPTQNVGIKEIKWANGKVKIYPNPACENIYIESEFELREDVSVNLIDLHGKKIKSELFYSHENTLKSEMVVDVGDVPEGVYIIQLEVNGMRYHEKLLISR